VPVPARARSPPGGAGPRPSRPGAVQPAPAWPSRKTAWRPNPPRPAPPPAPAPPPPPPAHVAANGSRPALPSHGAQPAPRHSSRSAPPPAVAGRASTGPPLEPVPPRVRAEAAPQPSTLRWGEPWEIVRKISDSSRGKRKTENGKRGSAAPAGERGPAPLSRGAMRKQLWKATHLGARAELVLQPRVLLLRRSALLRSLS